MRLLPYGLVMAVFVVVGGCADRVEADDDGRVRAVATTGMVAWAVEQVGGDAVRVEAMMGPGIDPHLYKATAGDVRSLSEADIIFYNGLHLESAMGEVLEHMTERATTVAVTRDVPRQRLLAPPEFAGAYDPHVWFDVTMWIYAVRTVSSALAEHDPARADMYRARGDSLAASLDSLDTWVRARVQELPADRRVLITAHDAFNYYGRAYGFEVRGLQGINTASEAGTADVGLLADEIARRRIPAIFVETSIPRRTIEAVQAAVRSRGWNVEIGGALFSDAMGDAGTDAGTYPGMVRHNVNTIVNALKGR